MRWRGHLSRPGPDTVGIKLARGAGRIDALPPEVAQIEAQVLASIRKTTAQSTAAKEQGITLENRQLLDGCKEGDVEGVRRALAAGADPPLGISFMFKAISFLEREVSLAIVSVLKEADAQA